MHSLDKEKAARIKLDGSTAETAFYGVSDSLNIGIRNAAVITQNIIISDRTSSDTSMRSLCPSLNSVSPETYNSIELSHTEKNLSCESSLSNLTATIIPPINLTEGSNGNLIFGNSSRNDKVPVNSNEKLMVTCSSLPTIMSSQELHSYDNFRFPAPLSENNFQNPQTISAATSLSQSCKSNLIISSSKCVASNSQQASSHMEEFSRSHLENNVREMQGLAFPALSETLFDKTTKEAMQNNLAKNIKHMEQLHHSIPSVHSGGSNEPILIADQMMPSSMECDIEGDNQLGFIPDHQDDQLLSHIANFHTIPSDSAKDPHSMRPEDLFLTDLHSSDGNELSLEVPLGSHITPSSNSVIPEIELRSNLVNCSSSSHLSELTMTSDFLVGGPGVPKTSPSQPPFLTSLSTTTDLALTFSSHFLDNSNMSIDIGSLSEGDASLNVSHSLSDTSDTPKKNGSELNFTNALKNVNERTKHAGKEGIESSRTGSKASDSFSECFKIPPLFSDSGFNLNKTKFKEELLSLHEEKVKGSPKEDLIPMVQVSCFKCEICNYLSLDKNDMKKHTKVKHVKKKRHEASQKVISKTESKMQTSSKNQELNGELHIIGEGNLKPGPIIQSDSSLDDQNEDSYSCKVETDTAKLIRQTKIPQIDASGSVVKLETDPTEHDLLNQFRCGINGCGLKMKKEENILYHRQCHVDAFLKCPECKVKFTHWSSLALHLWKNHMVDMELYNCSKCSYKAYSLTKLTNCHLRTHGDERPFLCDVCGKDFKVNKQLTNHKLLHCTKKEPLKYHCQVCQRNFAERRMLLNHSEVVHKKMKPYLCNFCGNSFASKSTLNLHIRIHTGEKPFACEHCNYRTSDHNSIRRHKMKHTNDRRYSCPYCEYTSIQSSTFKVHLRRKHEMQAQKDGVLFSCPYCSFKTVKKDNILPHLGTRHKLAEEERLKVLAADFQIDPPSKVNEESYEDSKKRKKTAKKLQKVAPSPIQQLYANAEIKNEATKKEWLEGLNANIDTGNDVMKSVATNLRTLRNGQIQTYYIIGELVPVQVIDKVDTISFQTESGTGLSDAEVTMGGGCFQLTPEVVAVPLPALDDTAIKDDHGFANIREVICVTPFNERI